MENRISITLPEADKAKITAALTVIKDILDPHLIALQDKERKGGLKMGDKTVAFVNKATQYAENNPDLTPRFFNLEEMKKDLEAVNTLTAIMRPLKQLVSNLDDTIMVAGTESLIAALSFYGSVKQASASNIPNAKPIYDDLKERFPGTRVPKPEPSLN